MDWSKEATRMKSENQIYLGKAKMKLEQIWLIDHTNHDLEIDFHTSIYCFTIHPVIPSFRYSKRNIRKQELVNGKTQYIKIHI